MKNERAIDFITDRLYEKEPYLKSFAATVVECTKDGEDYLIELDATGFFPAGGGQPSDVGFIGDEAVSEVFLKDAHIYHRTKNKLEVGSQVACQIDFDIRFRRMQNHSGEHVLCGLIHNAYGFDNVGFHMDEHEVVFDIDGVFTKEQLNELELRANQVIYENVQITVSYPDPEQVESLEFRSKLELTEGVRLVTIDGYDVCACCAPHVRSTGEIGIIKIISTMQHRGGMRITMVAGLSAFEDYLRIDSCNKAVMRVVSAKRYETGAFVEAMNDKLVAANQSVVELKRTITDLISTQIEQGYAEHDAKGGAAFAFFADSLDNVQLRNIVTRLKAMPCREDFLIIGFNGSDADGYSYIAAFHEDRDELRTQAKLINEGLSGRGGGNAQMIQGSVKASKAEIESFVNGMPKI